MAQRRTSLHEDHHHTLCLSSVSPSPAPYSPPESNVDAFFRSYSNKVQSGTGQNHINRLGRSRFSVKMDHACNMHAFHGCTTKRGIQAPLKPSQREDPSTHSQPSPSTSFQNCTRHGDSIGTKPLPANTATRRHTPTEGPGPVVEKEPSSHNTLHLILPMGEGPFLPLLHSTLQQTTE